jgi:plastocyanin
MYYFGATINVTFVKRTNGEDAKTGTGPLIGVGGAVDWTYTVTSSSNVSLPFTVVDNPVVAISCSKNTLDPTDEVVCTASGEAVAGQYSNTATLTVTRPGSLGNLILTDTSHYYGVITGINIEKRTNGFDADDAPGPLILIGENITWRYEITNTGNVDLTDMSVVDDKEGAITTCPTTIAAGATVTCTKTGTAMEGQYSNQATVTANPPAGFAPVTDSDSSHYYGSEAGVAIKKLTNGVDTSVSPPPNIKLGDPVSWTYQVTNIGLYTITGLAVTDSDETLVISCPGSMLEPDESMTCSASGTAKAGVYTNTGYAEGTPEGLEGIVGEVGDSDESGYFGVEPLIEITKTTNDEDAKTAPGVMIKVGETVAWRYEITNTGNVDLTDVSLVDDQEGPITCPATSLAVGITMTCSAQGTAIAGQYVNNATVTANTSPVEFGPVTDSDRSHYFGYTLSLDLVKRTNGQLVEAPPGPELEVGSTVTWTYEVTNTSNVDLTGVSVVDDQEGPITCPATSLAVGITMTCSAQGTAIAGQYTNNATVTANTSPVEFGPVTDSDRSYYFGYTLSLDLVKRTNGQLVEAPPGPELEVGSAVTWTYEVTNTSNVPLADIEIEDDMEGTITCPLGELGIGQSITCSTTGTVADGEYRNEAFASGKYGQDSVQSSIAISYYIGTSGLSIYLPLILR